MRLPDWLVTAGVTWLALVGLYTTIVLTVEVSNAIREEVEAPPSPIALFLAIVLLAPVAFVIDLSKVLWAGWLLVHRFLLNRSAIYQYAYSFVLGRRLSPGGPSSLHPAGCRDILDSVSFKSRRLESALGRCARGEAYEGDR